MLLRSRLRIFLKEKLSRDSVPYRIARAGYQAFEKVLNVVRPLKIREVGGNSIFLEVGELPMCSLFPKEILDLAIETFRPRTVLDVGCGTGVSLEYFKKRGIEAHGVEGSALALEHAARGLSVQQHDLHQPLDLGRKFDLVWCFEVAEHIHPDFADELVRTVSRHGDNILLSAARPGQGGVGHLNEQEPPYWIAKFEAAGFRYDEQAAAPFHALEERDILFARNILIFRRR